MVIIQAIVTLLAVFVLSVIAFDDFKTRTINIIYLLSLFLFSSYLGFCQFGLNDFASHTFINFIFILLQFLLTTVYFSLKERRLINLDEKYIGWGDWLFFLTICPLLPFPIFLLFFIISLAFIVLSAYILGAVFNINKKLPLAGILALLKIPVLFFIFFNPSVITKYQDWLFLTLNSV